MDSAVVMKMIFGLVGGLGIFLLGMKNMSEGMQAVAGAGLRKMIAAVTNNPLMATGVGVFVTCVVQSSSVTTVMVVGFVNSGVMTLAQAVGVVMGANIGTTITGWILVLKIGKYGLPLLGLMAFVYLFSRKEKTRYAAMTLMGVGMVFFGLEIMKDACGQIKKLPEFEAWLRAFEAHSYFGVYQCVIVGCVLTIMVQSSSATLGITIALAAKGAIPFETAAALVLGENIGTTITALLASIGATTNARRAAYFHCLFNIAGVIWITSIFFWYVDFVPTFLNYLREMIGLDAIDVTAEVIDNGETTYPDTTIAIAATHSIFNIVNTLLFVPFAGRISHLLVRIVPEKAHKETPHLTQLDVRMLETPLIAIEQSRVELLRMADGCEKMLDWLGQIHSQPDPDKELVQKLLHREEVLDRIQDEIVQFLTSLLAGNVPRSVIEEGTAQLRMADEYESISDYVRTILKSRIRLKDQGHSFDEPHTEQLRKVHELVARYVAMVNDGYENRRREVITKANSLGSEVRHAVKTARKKHMEWLTAEPMPPQTSVAWLAIVNAYRRVYDHALNVAEAFAGER